MDNWTPESVAIDIEQAAHTARRLPGHLRLGYLNVWPEILRMAPERKPEEPRLYVAPSAQALTHLLEVTRWMLWLDVESRHILWMRADYCEWAQIARRVGCTVRTVQRRRHIALATLAERLNQRQRKCNYV